MYTDFEGYYLDGQTAARQRAIILPLQDGLQITTEKGLILWWPYDEIQQNQGSCTNDQVRLERGRELPEVLLLPSASFLEELQKIRPQKAGHFHRRASSGKRLVFTLLTSLAAISIAMTIYFWGIPEAASLVASYVPVSWEEHLGQSVAQQLAPEDQRCIDPALAQALEDMTRALIGSPGKFPYTFRIVIINEASVNALAAPGGYIMIHQGLIHKTESPEELAGVLAHEMQHILLHHATQGMLQEASMGLLLAALMGDTSVSMAVGLEVGRTLGTMRYSRKSEEEADAAAVQMLLAAGINPAGFIKFFERLKKEQEKTMQIPAYLSTHPSLGERIVRLKALAQQETPRQGNVLKVPNWNRLRFVCLRKPSTPNP